MITSLLFASVTSALLLAGALRVHGGLAWFVALPWVLLRRDTTRWRDSLLFGAVFGAGVGLSVHAAWLAATAERYFGATPLFAWTSAVAGALFTGAAQGALLGVAMRAALRLPPPWPIAAGAGVWVSWEWLQGHVLPYYPWASLALGSGRLQANHGDTATAGTFVLGAGSILGQTGITFAMCAAGLALGGALFASARLRRGRAAAVVVGLASLVLTLGAIGHSRGAPGGDRPCSIAVIDAAVAGPSGSEQAYTTATLRAAGSWSRRPTVVIWPESAIEVSPAMDESLRRRLLALSSRLGIVLIAGGPRTSWSSDWSERRFNSAYRVEASGAIRAYDKRRIVPFAEYWPLPSIRIPRALQTRSIEAGGEVAVFAAGACRIGILICFEAESAALAREVAQAGADVLAVLSNDAALARAAADLEIAQARWRAVETGLAVVRAANAGTSFMALPGGEAQLAGPFEVPSPQPAPATWVAPLLLAAAWILSAVAAAAALSAAVSPAPSKDS